MRIDKYLCDALNITRSDAKKVVASGRVCLNGGIIKNAAAQIEETAEITLDGQPVHYQKFVYIMLHKPAGYVCANSDSRSKTVFDLLPTELRVKGLFVCGRLDKDTTGLVLLTNNGPLAHRLLAPKSGVFKAYYVTLDHPITARDIAALEQGITTRGGEVFRPARYEPRGLCEGVLYISEGKFHQIKRMFAALENHVCALHRLSIHGLSLDPALSAGACRMLNREEIAALEACAK